MPEQELPQGAGDAESLRESLIAALRVYQLAAEKLREILATDELPESHAVILTAIADEDQARRTYIRAMSAFKAKSRSALE